MFLANKVIRLIGKLPSFTGILFKVFIFVAALIENKFRFIDFPCQYNLVDVTVFWSTDSLSNLCLVYYFIFCYKSPLFALQQMLLIFIWINWFFAFYF